MMLFPRIFLAATALAVRGKSQNSVSDVVALSGNHSAATLPFWQNYTYCQARVIDPSTWQPLEDAFLVKLQVMHRHGARSPGSGPVPGDNTPWYQCGNPDEFVFMNTGNTLTPSRSPYMKEEVQLDGPFEYNLWQGNCDLGELTSLGSHRQNEVGQILRSVYVDKAAFLPSEMSSTIQISHTYIWRTRESVENLMAGMYPLPTRSVNQTLTMHVRPSILEVMIPNTSGCPRLASLVSAYANSTEYRSTLAPFAGLQTKLVEAYNTSSLSAWNTTQALFDNAASAYCHGLGLKGNLTAADIQTATIPSQSANQNVFRDNPNSTEVKQLAVGPWLKEILAAFDDRSSLLRIWSAHDTSLDMFLSVVAHPDLPWPPFSATVEMELWQHRTQGLVVRMFFEGMVVPSHPELDCSLEGCPYAVLREFLERYVVEDLQSACAV